MSFFHFGLLDLLLVLVSFVAGAVAYARFGREDKIAVEGVLTVTVCAQAADEAKVASIPGEIRKDVSGAISAAEAAVKEDLARFRSGKA